MHLCINVNFSLHLEKIFKNIYVKKKKKQINHAFWDVFSHGIVPAVITSVQAWESLDVVMAFWR